MSLPFRCIAVGLVALSACGQKPDGTPYGVNPAKLPSGQLKSLADSAQAAASFKGNKIPKAAELNAVTNGMRAGQPPVASPSQ